ncbi:mitochondrial carrier domain-containing protein [Mycotypha africana]|uniref:mitochondrial carrier domain-containing protein n=1 Tax=Mycotypha africana TaxID=64632 RepID=UPI002301C22B|nr:mitochondrial carrier domain-containing protein [Mycotypha africana]KAI8967215.1 mitochondrial carrier domain-containing protein [Mycotypha africana]
MTSITTAETVELKELILGIMSQAVKDCISGTVGGIAQVLVGQPFDTVKVRLQTQSATNPLYNGMLDCVKKTRAKEGIAGFYKGTMTPLVGIGACVSIQFVVLEAMKRHFASVNEKGQLLSNSQLYLAGAASGFANSFVSGPVEHIRTRLQVQTGTGYAGIYKGQGITMAREFQGYGAYFLAYEYLVQQAMQRANLQQRSDLPTWQVCAFGAAAGYAMWFTIYPMDVIKSKLQTDGFTPETKQYRSVLHCAKKTLAKEGVSGFSEVLDLVCCVLHQIPVNCFFFPILHFVASKWLCVCYHRPIII